MYFDYLVSFEVPCLICDRGGEDVYDPVKRIRRGGGGGLDGSMAEPPSSPSLEENKVWKGVFAVVGIMSTLLVYGVLQVHTYALFTIVFVAGILNLKQPICFYIVCSSLFLSLNNPEKRKIGPIFFLR